MNVADLLAYWKDIGAKRGEFSPVKLMGFRGGLVTCANRNGTATYDDLIAVIIDGVATFWRASTDPSPALIAHPINPDGAAQLCPGVHLFRPGYHKSNSAWPCLIQAEGMHVYRLNPDGSRKPDQQYGDFGIHIHSGGASESTGRFSAGCQIIRNDDGYFANPTWRAFYKPIIQGMSLHGLATVPYMLREDVAGISVERFEN